MTNIHLPDGSIRTFDGAVTGMELAANIGPGLAKAAVAIKVNGAEVDLSLPLPDAAQVSILTQKDDRGLDAARHTMAAQLLARAVKELYPSAKLAIGPTVEFGFYYDIEFETNISADDLPKIAAKMAEIQKDDYTVTRELWPAEKVKAYFADRNETYKVDIVARAIEKGEMFEGNTLSVYRQSIPKIIGKNSEDFIDLCRGPHAPSTGKTPLAFHLTGLAGAYWRGDSNNKQLTRIYGVAFREKKELEAHLNMVEESKKRDHRKLGAALDIFFIEPDKVGSGLPMWLPNGMVLRQELERLAIEEERRDGYHRVSTPVLAKEDLYYQSGHLPYYAEDMYAAIQIDEERYRLRPMNCPHHHHCYAARPKSYRELPYRIAEYGTVFRYEAHGALSGLMRARGFCQNDAHIYCTHDQAKDEFIKVMKLHQRFYNIFGIKDEDFYMRLSLPDLNKLDKYVDQPDMWLKALGVIKEAMDESGFAYKEAQGEAAFYGPKVDFQIKNAIGAEYTISTNQLDFLATQRFNLTYTGEDGTAQPVYVIHRAPLGSHERFIAFLIEHYEGRFPTWLAPVQAVVIPITDKQNAYAEKVKEALFTAPIHTATGGLRVETDFASERMQKKILFAQQRQIPYMLVVGAKEEETGTVAVRLRNGTDLGAIPLEQLLTRLKQEIETRTDIVA
ncbi:MAG: threonine--tRNA ligase [Alphaproteobacteria bacterium]